MTDFDFFKSDEIKNFTDVAATPYRKANEQHVAAGNLLKPLTRKLNEWVNLSTSEPYHVLNDNSWQWSGTFKEYLWIRVYRNSPINDPQPKVYYVFGLNDSGDLYMELNCQRSNHTMGTNFPLAEDKIQSFDNYLKASNYSPRHIRTAELTFYNWDRLVQETKDFIDRHAAIYNELLNILDPDHIVSKTTGKLNLVDKPEKIRSRVLDTPQFYSVDIDFIEKARTSKFLGDSGEDVVIEMEKKKLGKLNYLDLADLVKKVNDGEGYDVLSFDENRKEMYIEVKTTTGPDSEPFYLSHHEYLFAKLNQDSYYIYRVCNYRSNPSGGNLFVWTWKDLAEATRKPLQYEISKQN